jgi:hypothetical protein
MVSTKFILINGLGTPKYENGLDILFKLGYTPEEALVKWAEYNPINKKWGKKKNV